MLNNEAGTNNNVKKNVSTYITANEEDKPSIRIIQTIKYSSVSLRSRVPIYSLTVHTESNKRINVTKESQSRPLRPSVVLQKQKESLPLPYSL